jgi:HEAT repeat protein
MTIPGLLAVLKHDGRSGKPVLGLEWLVAYLFASLMLFVVLVRAAPWYDDWSFLTYMLFCAVVLRWVYLVINRMVASPQQRQAAQRLTQLQDKRVVGHLVDFCTWPDALVRQAARKALVSMLPQLQAADASLLSSEQQGVLRGMLHRRHVEAEPGLQIAILKAYEQMGDERALPAVNALATMRSNTKNRQRVRVAAEECLPFLQQRRQRQVSSQTLLRPTQLNTPEPPREVLLRAAHDPSASNPAELLRPNASDDPAGT